MYTFNPRSLLKSFIELGFPPESISKATGISTDLIKKYQENYNLTPKELEATEYLTVFTSQLYYVDVTDNSYLLSLVEVLKSYFKIPDKAICRYIGLEEIALEDFFANPQDNFSYTQCAKKLVHLYITFIRDKHHS